MNISYWPMVLLWLMLQELGLGPSVPVHAVLQDWIRHSDGKLSFLGFVKLLHGISSRTIAKAQWKFWWGRIYGSNRCAVIPYTIHSGAFPFFFFFSPLCFLFFLSIFSTQALGTFGTWELQSCAPGNWSSAQRSGLGGFLL